MSKMFTPRLLIVGHRRHGVTRYAQDLGAPIARLTGTPFSEPIIDAAAAEAATTTIARAHLHVTDRIFGTSPEDAADRITRMARTCRLTVTLHDLPQPSDGEHNLHRRSSAYRRIARASTAVAVSSEHELALFTRYVDDASTRATIVVPLGSRARVPSVGRSVPAPSAEQRDLIVLLAGFVYPGKGHDDAIRAAAKVGAHLGATGAPPVLRVRALGAVADGHGGEQERLAKLANVLGVQFEITGFLSDNDYTAARADPGIPVAAHQHISASRTLLDWADSGRKPLVVASAYAREMDSLRPGTLSMYDPDRLPEALEAAWRDPLATYLPTPMSTPWTLEDAAAAYMRWWNETVIW